MHRTFIWLAAGLLLAGCEEPRIESYTTKKESAPPAQAMPQPPAAPSSPPQAVDASWPIPEGWTVDPQQRPMRLATFRAGEGGNSLEVALSEFPGDTGGILANVNRWRGQVGLPETTLAEFEAEASIADHGPVRLYTMRFRGPSVHMLGAMLFNQQANRTRFLKATGPAAEIDAHEAAFNDFAARLAQDWGKG
jgi:hypothetical protein